MTCKCHKNASTIDRVEHCLEEVMAIDLDEFERLVQKAHECDIQQIEDPEDIFPISRQALRMFWYFRRNMDAVQIHAEQSP